MRLPSNSMHELLISSMTNGKLWLHNLRLPMSRLPTELFHQIFILVVYAEDEDRNNSVATRRRLPKRDLSWLAITHVCRLWREIALSCAVLWTNIDTSKRLLALDSLERSASAPLSVIVDKHTEEEEIDAVNFALAELARIKELEIRWRPLRLGQCTQLLERPAPMLETFLFSGASARMASRTVLLPPTIFEGCSPELRSLTLIRSVIPYSAPVYSGLKSLELFDIDAKEQPALRQLLAILSACPDLEKLVLVNAGPKEESLRIIEKSKALIIPKACVKLLSLRDVTIDSRTNASKTLLNYIIVPPVVRISICVSIPPKFPSSGPSNAGISNIAHISDILPPHIRPSAQANALHMSFDVKYGFEATVFTHYPQIPSPPFSRPEATSFSLKYWLYTRERARRIWPLTVRVFLSLVWRTVLLAQLEHLRIGFEVDFEDEVLDSDSEYEDDDIDYEDRDFDRPMNSMSVKKDFWFDLFRLAPQLRKLEIYEDPEVVQRRRLRTVRMGLGRNNRQRTPALDLVDALLIANPHDRRQKQRSNPSIRTRFRTKARQVTQDKTYTSPSTRRSQSGSPSSTTATDDKNVPWPLLTHLHFNGVDFSFSHDFFSKLFAFLHSRSSRGDPVAEIRIENCVGMKNDYLHTLSEVVGGIIWDGKGLELEGSINADDISEVDFDSEKASEVDFESVVVGEDLC